MRASAKSCLHRHVEPLGVEADLDQLGVGEQDPARLLLVGARVGVDLLARQRRPRVGAAARVADARCVVADDQHDAVTEVLELAQLLEHDGVAEVDVGRGRIDTELDPQRPALRLGCYQLGLQSPVGERGVGVAGQPCGGL